MTWRVPDALWEYSRERARRRRIRERVRDERRRRRYEHAWGLLIMAAFTAELAACIALAALILHLR